MSGRPVEPVEIPPACPFLAFEDDRDRRSTAPDHRHRCYAEPRPAPRAFAHQERYCLTRDFPSCPTFQAWARREAALGSEPGATREVAAGRPPADPGAWLAGSSGRAAGTAAAAGATAAVTGQAADGGGRRQGRARGMESGQLAAFEDPDPGPVDEAEPPGNEELAALVGGAAVGGAAVGGAAGPSGPLADGDTAASEVPGFLAGRTAGTRSTVAGGRKPRGAPAAAKVAEGDNPPWERPRRAELYPSLRTRSGMPNVPPVALALIALVIAAVGLFLLPSLLGNPGGSGASDSASAPPSSAATSALPTLAAGPTPFTYTVKSGDLLSTIAKHFGVTLADLEAANPQIKDFNKIVPGDKITIPIPGTSGGPSATP